MYNTATLQLGWVSDYFKKEVIRPRHGNFLLFCLVLSLEGMVTSEYRRMNTHSFQRLRKQIRYGIS